MMEEQMTEEWQILDLLATTQDATVQMHAACLGDDKAAFDILSDDVEAAYQSITPLLRASDTKSLFLVCESIIVSLKRIVALHDSDQERCAHKIEFELLPLIKGLYMQFYYFEIASKDENLLKKYMEHDRFMLGANTYIDESEKTGEYKYELSIAVTGYNKLEYTTACVESLLKHIPSNLNYELILFNHGSTDGTKEYFESIKPHKQLDIFRNGGHAFAYNRIIEGRYALFISNDVLITENAILNMLAAIKSDPEIAYLVPTTPNVSNFQTIPTVYRNMDEMYSFAAKNNISDPLKWEQRARLCNPVTLVPSSYHYSSSGIATDTYFTSFSSFPDDKLSYFVRKAGKKMILAKDAYCYHFGSVTLRDEGLDEDYYMSGIEAFNKDLGINPWGKGFCYDLILFHELNLQKADDVNILGVSPGIGSNPLKFKTLLRELGSENTRLFLVTEEEHFRVDYETYTEPGYVEIAPVSKFASAFPAEKFDYITVETHTTPSDVCAYKKRLRPGGKLLVWCGDRQAVDLLQEAEPQKAIHSKTGVWYIL